MAHPEQLGVLIRIFRHPYPRKLTFTIFYVKRYTLYLNRVILLYMSDHTDRKEVEMLELGEGTFITATEAATGSICEITKAEAVELISPSVSVETTPPSVSI